MPVVIMTAGVLIFSNWEQIKQWHLEYQEYKELQKQEYLISMHEKQSTQPELEAQTPEILNNHHE